jgi:hypothetical protein
MAMAVLAGVSPMSMVARAGDVHANAQGCDAETEVDLDDLLIGGDNCDWSRGEALLFHLD